MPNAKIVRTDNSYRSYECLLNADIFVLKMKICPDTLKRRHVFTQGRTCYEIHAGFVKCLWKHCFVQIVTLTDLSSRCPESQNEAGS